jgi:hypothetical protein
MNQYSIMIFCIEQRKIDERIRAKQVRMQKRTGE